MLVSLLCNVPTNYLPCISSQFVALVAEEGVTIDADQVGEWWCVSE